MKRLIYALILVTMFSSLAFAEWQIQPKYFDFNPNDGFMEVGTPSNPYVIKDSWGNTKATVKPKYFDFTPNDGFMDIGTNSNPYVIDWGR